MLTICNSSLPSWNTPFYRCVFSYLAYECKRGWRWPCFDTDLSGFSFKCQLVSIRAIWFAQRKQRGLYQDKVTCSLASIQWPVHWTDKCKMVFYDQVKLVLVYWGFLSNTCRYMANPNGSHHKAFLLTICTNCWWSGFAVNNYSKQPWSFSQRQLVLDLYFVNCLFSLPISLNSCYRSWARCQIFLCL